MQEKIKDDTISRQAAIDALDQQIRQCDKALADFGISMKDEYAVRVERASLVAFKEQLECLPPAQPPYNPDEWCHNCKEYDQERHSCPRWNRVIRKTVDELRAEQAERREENDQYTGNRLAEGLRAKPG